MADYLMPACMKDWTNCLWNSKKAMSSGATDINVAAVIIDQSTPDSGAPKIPSPTVKGRVSTELLTTRGHRKLFQWWLQKAAANAPIHSSHMLY